MQLAQTTSLGGLSESDLLSMAASVESATRHPLAESVTRAAKDQGISIPHSTHANTESGSGVHAVVDGLQVQIRPSSSFTFLPSIRTPVVLLRCPELRPPCIIDTAGRPFYNHLPFNSELDIIRYSSSWGRSGYEVEKRTPWVLHFSLNVFVCKCVQIFWLVPLNKANNCMFSQTFKTFVWIISCFCDRCDCLPSAPLMPALDAILLHC